jgi:hypothetical protein
MTAAFFLTSPSLEYVDELNDRLYRRRELASAEQELPAAIFGLIGVVVGGFLNAAVSWWAERQRRFAEKQLARRRSPASCPDRRVNDLALHQIQIWRARTEERYYAGRARAYIRGIRSPDGERRTRLKAAGFPAKTDQIDDRTASREPTS